LNPLEPSSRLPAPSLIADRLARARARARARSLKGDFPGVSFSFGDRRRGCRLPSPGIDRCARISSALSARGDQRARASSTETFVGKAGGRLAIIYHDPGHSYATLAANEPSRSANGQRTPVSALWEPVFRMRIRTAATFPPNFYREPVRPVNRTRVQVVTSWPPQFGSFLGSPLRPDARRFLIPRHDSPGCKCVARNLRHVPLRESVLSF